MAGDCGVAIDMHSDDDEDSMSFHDIAVETGVILIRCVAHPPHLGGTQPVGPKKVMNVTVFGYREPPRGRPLGELSLAGDDAANATTTSLIQS